MFFDDVHAYPRLYETYYKTLEEFVEGLYTFEGKLEETFAEYPDYTMEMKTYMTNTKGFIIEIKVNKIK